MRSMITLSVLDQSPVRSGGTVAHTIQETFDLAQAADRLGYHRYLLAQDHLTTAPARTVLDVLLGSSGESARIAAHFGAAFSFAHFISADGSVEATRAYLEGFRPSPALDHPRASVAVFVVVADTEAEALRLARSRELFIVRLYTG